MIKIICDMCTREVKSATPLDAIGITSGYYYKWYGREITCDHCMWTRVPQYEKTYGKVVCNCDVCIGKMLENLQLRLLAEENDIVPQLDGEERNILVEALNKVFKR
jgi:hypothetical protein